MSWKNHVICLLVGSAFGCREQAQPQSGTPQLTNGELLQLMDGELFEVRVPQDIGPEQFAGLAIRHSDGRFVRMGGSNGWTPGETVRVVCFPPEGNRFRYTCFRKLGLMRGSTVQFPKVYEGLFSANHKRTNLEARERLIRYTMDNKMSSATAPEGDDFDVVFHVQEANEADESPRAEEP